MRRYSGLALQFGDGYYHLNSFLHIPKTQNKSLPPLLQWWTWAGLHCACARWTLCPFLILLCLPCLLCHRGWGSFLEARPGPPRSITVLLESFQWGITELTIHKKTRSIYEQREEKGKQQNLNTGPCRHIEEETYSLSGTRHTPFQCNYDLTTQPTKG